MLSDKFRKELKPYFSEESFVLHLREKFPSVDIISQNKLSERISYTFIKDDYEFRMKTERYESKNRITYCVALKDKIPIEIPEHMKKELITVLGKKIVDNKVMSDLRPCRCCADPLEHFWNDEEKIQRRRKEDYILSGTPILLKNSITDRSDYKPFGGNIYIYGIPKMKSIKDISDYKSLNEVPETMKLIEGMD